MNVSLHRIRNSEYLGHRAQGRAIHVTTDPLLNAEIAHSLATKAVERLVNSQKPKTVRFRYGGKKWKVVPINEKSLWQRFLRFLDIFSAKPVEGRFDRYRLESAHRPMKRQKHKSRRTMAGHALSDAKKAGITEKDFKEGVREKIAGKSDLASFSRISADAFQKHETLFCPGDDTKLSHLDYRIILKEGGLQLVHKNSLQFTEPVSKAAIEAWKRQYIDLYGEKKFNDMLRFYKLDMDSGLTAEHVYRANIYATNVDIDDLKGFAARVFQNQPLTGFEQQCLKSLPECKERLDQVQGDVSKLSPEDFSKLCKSFYPSQAQLDELLTGRKIRYPISSNYSIGGLGAYKPWIDQQELSEIFPVLEKCKSWESYQELLAHVVVKKHLMREHAKDDLRLGVLIPAPPKEAGGPVRYYMVRGCISNGGILSYILESPCGDPSLPAIKLYRSTAQDTYALNWSDTIINDLNHLNSPGYLGVRDIDFYEKQFFKQHTIPVWVGYQHLAKQALEKGNKQEARALLDQANQALETELHAKIQRPSFLSLLQTHDRPINAVFFPYNSGSFKDFLKSHRGDLLAELINKYLHERKDRTEDEHKKDAHRLNAYLSEVQKGLKPTDALFNQIQALRDDLKKWYSDQKLPELEPKDQAILETVKNLANEKNEMLQEWAGVIEDYAKENHDDIASKKPSDIHVSGHSLGGACAAVAIARYMAIDGRMPLPNHKCSGTFFDDPGLNAEDNAKFLRYGEAHAELFKKSNVGFSIFRRHEAGDVVPSGGGMGLGSTETKEESETLNVWCGYDAAVNRRKKSATHLEVAESVAAHGTRFLEAVAGRDFKATPVTPYEEGLLHRGSNWQLSGEELDQYRKIARKVWKLGSPLKRVFQEHLRRSLSLPMLLLRYQVASAKAEHVFPEELLDNNGAFAKVI
jgi:hypothetical protein